MLFRTRADRRPYHLGPFPLEVLARDGGQVAAAEVARPRRPAAPIGPAPDGPLAAAARGYRERFAALAEGEPAAARAPVPEALEPRAADLKGYGYFMNAAQVGICRIPANAWTADAERPDHGFAVVLLVEHGRMPEPGNPAEDWVRPAVDEVTAMRAAEISVCLARHIARLGFSARAHVHGNSLIDAERLAVLAGLAQRDGAAAVNPFLGRNFCLAVVSTDYEIAADRPLAASARPNALRYWLGINGATSGRERNRRAGRATHLSRYPMEQVKRVERPTTLILEDEVPRVPKRAAFFDRALRGDLGPKSRRERNRFAFKQPHTSGMMAPMRAMVPIQGGEPAAGTDTQQYADPAANARAVKSLAYHLGADLAGICEIPDYAWYSHDGDGQPIAPRHRYAVVMLIDQEYDTMEGASGDDWISGAQSMRAYLRGAEIAGVMGETLRALGFPARSQTNVDSEVLHIPLLLLAGLGELSRIGELVLNPFVGPRFKSVVLTTDMPLQPDRPIDFGLQYFCNHCWKCARECPCDAIPLGPKVMFNGYETWKPDVERCARYRLTNPKGSACGRCMKTCPLNKVVTADGPLAARIASWLGIHARWLKPLLVPIATRLDDRLGNGRRNPVKRWWIDFEIVDGICVAPVAGTNQRDIDPGRSIDPAKQKMAVYPAAMMPVPNVTDPQPVDRKAALAAHAELETPAEARARKARGGAPPAQYTPTPPGAAGTGEPGLDLETYGEGGGEGGDDRRARR